MGSSTSEIKIYVAGKIDHDDWRNQIVPVTDRESFGFENPWEPIQTTTPGVTYTGPFFTDCGHGFVEGVHGQSDCDPNPRDVVVQRCQRAIAAADMVYVWLDELERGATTSSAYGTLVEVGYATALGKRVVVAASRAPVERFEDRRAAHPVDDLWFAWHSTPHRLVASTPYEGFLRSVIDAQADARRIAADYGDRTPPSIFGA